MRESREQILEAIKQLADQKGRAPTLRELTMAYGITKSRVQRVLGTYEKALAEFGLTRQDNARPYTKRELCEIWAKAARQKGGLPSGYEFRVMTGTMKETVARRFGGWSTIHEAMLEVMERENLVAEWADVVKMIKAKQNRAVRLADPVRHYPARGRKEKKMEVVDTPHAEEPGTEEVDPESSYGEPINHPAMTFAPTNEAGVMILFGAMARKLGFVILRSQAGYPDVEAMRVMKNGRLKREQIEVEFLSRNFKRHVHDPKKCDRIVCWEHNWPECPVPVVELKAYFRK